jgi:catechol 2,3-dioxygenase-like lactoylglutathione lyase family enzyme
MIGHIGFYVDDLQKNDKFYRPLLEVIGYDVIFALPQCIAYGANGVPFLEIYTGKPKSTGIHVAFHVPDKQTVDMFHSVALSIGGSDHGKPGYRDYFPNYYASFIIDPNGYNLEALFWEPRL